MPATARITGSRSNRPDSGPSSDITVHATADGETTQHGPFAYYADAYSYWPEHDTFRLDTCG